MKETMVQRRAEAIGNGMALVLGLAFLGDLFELWNFNPYDGWCVLFLYIPAITGFIKKGITSGGVLLTLTAIVLTVGIFTEIDGRIWGAALLIYLAFLGGRSVYRKWNGETEVLANPDKK
ncbi:MAG: hypothetical protein Q4G58_09175 [bacterium]|nr:hypothetical protein [bacterium]